MVRKTAPHPISPRVYLNTLQSQFGKAYLKTTFRADGSEPLTDRTIDRWLADPDYVGEDGVRQNPLEKFHTTLRRCMSSGLMAAARGVVATFVAEVGCEMTCPDRTLQPDKACWYDELLDDIPALTEFQEAARGHIEGSVDIAVLKHLEGELIREIRETTVKIITERSKME